MRKISSGPTPSLPTHYSEEYRALVRGHGGGEEGRCG